MTDPQVAVLQVSLYQQVCFAGNIDVNLHMANMHTHTHARTHTHTHTHTTSVKPFVVCGEQLPPLCVHFQVALIRPGVIMGTPSLHMLCMYLQYAVPQ